MSCSDLTLSHNTTHGSWWAAPRTALLQAIEIVELWGERRHQRRALRELPDHVRRDIALSPADVEAEASKPFWRA
jgi:uncharacterized protein YjiS (DUF1127 family)